MFARPLLEHRFFFALLPPTRIAWQVANAAYWFDTAGSPVSADRLHVTLFILPDVAMFGRVDIDALRAVGDAISAAPVPMTLDMVGGGNRSIALRPKRKIAQLETLRRDLAAQARAAGVPERANYDFHAHMTLGYRDAAPFTEAIAPVEWVASEFVLIHSHLGQTRHDVLGRWALQGVVDRQLRLL